MLIEQASLLCGCPGSAGTQLKERPEDLLPELESFLKANVSIKAVPKVTCASVV